MRTPAEAAKHLVERYGRKEALASANDHAYANDEGSFSRKYWLEVLDHIHKETKS